MFQKDTSLLLLLLLSYYVKILSGFATVLNLDWTKEEMTVKGVQCYSRFEVWMVHCDVSGKGYFFMVEFKESKIKYFIIFNFLVWTSKLDIPYLGPGSSSWGQVIRSDWTTVTPRATFNYPANPLLQISLFGPGDSIIRATGSGP